jgi:hypothetical protein
MADLGSWGFFAKVSIQPSEVPSDRTGFPVYVDLSDLDATFFNEVQSDGADIRVTESDRSTLVPREVESIDTGAQTGELWFKAPSLSSSNVTDFYVFFGNASASAPAVTDPNGRNAVWSDYAGVWHNGATEDSTGNFGAPSQNTVTPGGATGQIGDATLYSGGDEVQYGSNTALDFGTGDFHISAWLQVGDTPDGGAVIDLYSGDTSPGFMFKWRSGMGLLTADGANGYDQRFGTNFSNNELHHLFAARDAAGRKRQYVDGVEDLNYTLTARDVTNNSAIYLGRSPFNSDSWDERLDEVRVASTAPTAAWAATEYNNTNSPSTFYNVAASESNGFSGSGTGTAQGSGQITRRRGFSGSGVGTAQGFGSLNRIPLAGSGVAQALGKNAPLRVNRPLSGSGVATAQGGGELNLKSTMGGSGEAQASGQGGLNVRVSFEGSGVGRAQGSVKLTGARVFGGAGVAEAFGSGELGDIKAHWVFVNGNVESEDAGASLNVTGLDPSVVHVFQVAALDTGYNFSVPATIKVSPIALEKTGGAEDSQTLRVRTADPSFYDEIELYRKKTQGASWSLYHTFSDPSSAQEFTDVALDPGTTYYYEARGVGGPSTVDAKSKARGFQTAPVVELTVDSSKITSDIPGYPVYVDLSAMPASFWSNVSEEGEGIRVTDALGNPLPREVVRIDLENQEGEMHFKGDVSSGSDTTFTINVTDKSAPAPTDPEGRNAVWSNYEAVWHLDENPAGASAAKDSTGNGYDASFNGGLDETDEAESPLGGGVLLEDDQYLAPAGPDLKGLRDGLQFEAWFRTGSDGIIASWDRNEQFRMEVGGDRNQGDLGTSYQYDNSSTDDDLNDTSTNATDNNWHHSVFRYEQGDAKQVTDGAVQSDRSQGSEIGTNTSRYGFFGSGSEATSANGSKGPTNWWNGGLDEARLATQALSMAQVKASYENQANPGSFFSVGLGSVTQFSIARSASTKTSMTIEAEVKNPSFFSEVRLLVADAQGGPYSVVETYENPPSSFTYEDTGLSEGDTRYYKVEAEVKVRDETLSATSSFTLVLLPDSITFDNQGSTGITGPDSTSYSWDSTYEDLSTEIFGNGKQVFQVPAGEGGTYRIEALGAGGGKGDNFNGTPGKGARIEGEFDLSGGDILHILVGQKGTDGPNVGGGGGATHVAKYDPDTGSYTELISAGAGAGAGGYDGGDGRSQLSSDDSGGGGCAGSAGFRGNGSGGEIGTSYSFTNGGNGSPGDNGGGDGGFGGGAGSEDDGGGTNDDFGAGGGYQGAQGPCNNPAEGGYSYNDGANQNNVAGDNAGHGEVKLILPKGL